MRWILTLLSCVFLAVKATSAETNSTPIDTRVNYVIELINQLTNHVNNSLSPSDYSEVGWAMGHSAALLTVKANVLFDLGTYLSMGKLNSRHFDRLLKEFKIFSQLFDPFDLKQSGLDLDQEQVSEYFRSSEDIKGLLNSAMIFSLFDYSAIDKEGGLKRFQTSVANTLDNYDPVGSLLRILRRTDNRTITTVSLLDDWMRATDCDVKKTVHFLGNVYWLNLAGLITEEIYLGVTTATQPKSKPKEVFPKIGIEARKLDFTDILGTMVENLSKCWRLQRDRKATSNCESRVQALRSDGELLRVFDLLVFLQITLVLCVYKLR